MERSRAIPSSSSASPDLARNPAAYPPERSSSDDQVNRDGSVNMEELFRSIGVTAVEAPPSRDGSDAVGDPITLEEYIGLGQTAGPEGIRVPSGDPLLSGRQQLTQFPLENPILGFGSGVDGGGGQGGRGQKRTAIDPTDWAALQRQKRMIKNRESAARSRERKQAYTSELETLVERLEKDTVELQREEEELIKQRRKQLLENIIPVTEGKKPRRPLRRTQSMEF